MKRITLYTMNNCPHCQQVKQYLDHKGVKYRLCNVKTPSGQKEMLKLGIKAVPALMLGDTLIRQITQSTLKNIN